MQIKCRAIEVVVAISIVAGMSVSVGAHATPGNLALARQYWRLQGGLATKIGNSLMVSPTQKAAQALARQKAIEKNRAALAVADEKVAQLLASALTMQELTILVKFYDSPVGHGIHAKQQTLAHSIASGKLHRTFLKAEEYSALDSFRQSSTGRDTIAKLTGLRDRELQIIAPVRARIRVDYCSQVQGCPPG